MGNLCAVALSPVQGGVVSHLQVFAFALCFEERAMQKRVVNQDWTTLIHTFCASHGAVLVLFLVTGVLN